MVTIDDLKVMIVLSDLPDDKLAKLAKLAKEIAFNQEDVIFSENQPGDTLFFLKSGKVLLERKLKPKVTLSLGAVNPCMTFGWTSLESSGIYSWDAVCNEASVVFAFNIDELKKLCDEDNTLGYLLMANLMINIKARLDFRTEQLLRVIRSHPDLQF